MPSHAVHVMTCVPCMVFLQILFATRCSKQLPSMAVRLATSAIDYLPLVVQKNRWITVEGMLYRPFHVGVASRLMTAICCHGNTNFLNWLIFYKSSNFGV